MNPDKTLDMIEERDKKAELTLLIKVEGLPSQGAKRDFCKEIGCDWDEYLRLKRKWRIPLERYKNETQT